MLPAGDARLHQTWRASSRWREQEAVQQLQSINETGPPMARNKVADPIWLGMFACAV